jgi:hypothetical protein
VVEQVASSADTRRNKTQRKFGGELAPDARRRSLSCLQASDLLR